MFVLLVAALLPAAGASAPSVATASARRVAAAGGCPAGTEPTGAAALRGGGPGYPGLPGEPDACAPLGAPEGPPDVAARDAFLAAPSIAGSGPVPAGAYAAAVAQRQRMAVAASPGSSWKPYGSAPLMANGPYDQVVLPGQDIHSLGFANLTGRITDFAYDATNPNRVFASGAEGGVWESRDQGVNWFSIGDRLITQSVGAIAWTPAGGPGGTLVVGTGDNSQGRYNYSGHGIFFSRDDGIAWLAATGIPDPSQNFRIAVDPTNPTVMYAANSLGLFRGVEAADGSSLSFTNVNLKTNAAGTAVCPPADVPRCLFANNVTDVVVRPAGGSTPGFAAARGATIRAVAADPGGEVLATVGFRFGNRFYETADGTGSTPFVEVPHAGIYRSATGAPGTFQYVTGGTNGYPALNHAGRVGLAVAGGPGQNHNIIYALVQDPIKEGHCNDDLDAITVCLNPPPALILPAPGANLGTVLEGAFMTSDFGSTWTEVMNWSQLDQPGTGSAIGGPGGQFTLGYGPGIQSWYNNWISVDPTRADASGNPTRVLFGLEELWQNNPTTTAAVNPAVNDWKTQPPDSWTVFGRYWNACGPFTFGQGFNCNAAASPVGGTTTHPDQHAAMFIPDGSGGVKFFAGSDGGIFTQAANASHPSFDNDSWGNGASNQVMVLQPYDAEIAKDGTVVAGMQDNGEMKIDPKTGKLWQIYGGDGFWSAIDPNNSNNMMEEYVGGRTAFSQDGGVTWTIINPSLTNARFSTPVQMDPGNANHFIIGAQEVYERQWGYTFAPCAPATPADPFCLVTNANNDWDQVYDLGPGNSTSADDVRGDAGYVAFCTSCDPLLEGNPFSSGIATNMGGGAAPKFANPAGWHKATAACDVSQCGTANGRLPQRWISSVRIDPADNNTIYVTMGGYQRDWVLPGQLGEANPNVGIGHVFKSTDHGEHFVNISGNLPNIPARFSLVHNGHLEVATDIGVFESTDVNGGSYSVLGASLPAAPVDTIRLAPGNPDLMIAATWGRGVYAYCFSGASCPVNTTTTTTSTGGPGPSTLPNTTGGPGPVVPLALLGLLGALLAPRRLRQRLHLP